MSLSQTIKMESDVLHVPDNPVIPYIEGDGIGPDIWKASVNVFDNAVDKACKGSRKINWLEILAGEKALIRQVSGFHKKRLILYQITSLL